METIDVSQPTLSTFITVFLSVYLIGYLIVFRRWSPKHRSGASSCLMSLAHGTPSVFMAIHAIYSQGSFTIASPNTPLQNVVLEFSIAYFLMDTLHYMVFFPCDVLFIAHHLATLYVFLTSRYVILCGGFELLVILVLAEITSACQNMWSLAKLRKFDEPAAAKLHDMLSAPFYAFYSIVRGVCAPIFVYKMGAFYLSGAVDHFIPRWAWVSWMIVIATGIFLSILWVANLWTIWRNERIQKMHVKSK